MAPDPAAASPRADRGRCAAAADGARRIRPCACAMSAARRSRSGRLAHRRGRRLGDRVIYALGEKNLVATDSASLFPAAARATPKIGYMRTPSAEGVLSLRPTLVITRRRPVRRGAAADRRRRRRVLVLSDDYSFDAVVAKIEGHRPRPGPGDGGRQPGDDSAPTWPMSPRVARENKAPCDLVPDLRPGWRAAGGGPHDGGRRHHPPRRGRERLRRLVGLQADDAEAPSQPRPR